MRLSVLVKDDAVLPDPFRDQEICGLTSDSRTIRPGSLFAALSGTKQDGARFIRDAAASGAVAILARTTANIPPDLGVPVVRSDEPRRALAKMAARFYGRQPEAIVAVTGTSGKTSVADFTRQILAHCGFQAASMGTIGIVKPSGAVYGSLTTPDPIQLHEALAGLAADGITHLAMEASSHGLDQHRLDGVRLKAGAFTNLGRDHLDYHADARAYLAAKLRLFSELLPDDATVVVNADDPSAASVIQVAAERNLPVIDTGMAAQGLHLESLVLEDFAQNLIVSFKGQRHTVRLPLLGAYQASNALVAAGLAIAAGARAEAAVLALGNLTGVKGRLEIAGKVRDGLVIIDYAHKPEALSAALEACRTFARGRLICVFGCGGDRDRGKRPLMGRIAYDKADIVIITDDNPRTEDAASIRAQIRGTLRDVMEIADRRDAIREAIAMCGPGDVVIVAGKGHETGQIVGDKVIPFSDHDEVRSALGPV